MLRNSLSHILGCLIFMIFATAETEQWGSQGTEDTFEESDPLLNRRKQNYGLVSPNPTIIISRTDSVVTDT